MTPTEQRIAIAEACGWTSCLEGNFKEVYGYNPTNLCREETPDYFNDLNAMASAEDWLRNGGHKGEAMWFNSYLDKLSESYGDYSMVATAAQRAEAFLRTIGKWKD